MTPRYGSRLLPSLVDETAKTQPDLPYAYVPVTTNVSDGFKPITFSEIAAATDHIAAWIHSNLGPSSSFETLAYMGLGDLRYAVVFLAAVKCGYKVLLPSTRNSSWMNKSLLEQTRCRHFLFAPEVEALVRPLVDHRADLQLHSMGALEDMIRPGTAHYPYEKEFDAVKWDPILILHSSGSTGPPKPIVMNHATFAVGDNDRNLPTVPGRVNQNWSLWDFPQQETFFSPFPAFHLAGFSSMVLLPIYYQNAKLVVAPPTRPPTGHLVGEIMDHFELKSIFCPPIIAEELVQEADGLEKCKNLKFLLYAGGPLSQGTGEKLSKVTDVCQIYGQTETGAIQTLVPRRDDWASLEWHPVQEAIMEPYVDGLYEMTMKRNPALEKVRSLSANFPDADVWHTKDLFTPHPTKPDLWTLHGRVDDIIVLSNGEKFNPVPSEVHISAHPLVNGALIIGQGHPQSMLILEPKDESQSLEYMIQVVWPTIEEANSQAPGQARITRDMIMLASPSKSFIRSPKGTVVRTSTSEQYRDEISKLYAREVSKNFQHLNLDSLDDPAVLSEFISDVVASAFPGHTVEPSDDLFVLGMDSLQAMEIVKLVNNGIRSNRPEGNTFRISMRFIYEHPSISNLAKAISLAHSDVVNKSPQAHQSESHQERIRKMEAMVEKYTQDLPVPPVNRPTTGTPTHNHVVLTGSTGSLGTQLLMKLLSEPKVTRITCLDRSANARERITQSLSTRPSPPDISASRVSFHQADYGKPDFGLEPSVLSDLRETANIVIHNAWKVDFNHSLESFEQVHVRGVRHLVDLSTSKPLRPRLVFISSISSVGRWPDLDSGLNVIPETLPPSLAAAQPMGYASSKAVAEHILDAAAHRSGLDASVLRVGQIAGPAAPENGARWNETEWFPLMLKTVRTIRKIPDARALGNVDWVPVDLLASAIWELAVAPRGGSDGADSTPSRIYHLVNPKPRPWADLLPVVKARLGGASAVEETTMEDWIAELEKTDQNDREAIASVPAVKILGFFKKLGQMPHSAAESGVQFATENAKASSRVSQDLEAVKEEWMLRWMKDWGLVT